jgi:hypothetical protein
MKITGAKPRISVIGAFLIMTLLFQNQAAARVISTFDTGLEGWLGDGCSLSWDQGDGNPLPALHFGDTDGTWSTIIAPAKFHGHWSSTGVVSVDIKFKGTGIIAYPAAFAITDGNTTYQYIFTSLPTAAWQTFSASLTDPNWTRVDNSSAWDNWSYWTPPIGTETLVQVLKNVTDFRIRTDYTDDSNPAMDAADLDNIKAPLMLYTPVLTLLLLD